MAKFTILRPPSGHTLHIPTVAGLVINLTFTMQDEQYLLDGNNLKAILPDNTVLVFDKLLGAASDRESAPQILQPEDQPINTHDLLIGLGVDPATMKEAGPKAHAGSNSLLSTNLVNELLASSLDMEQQPWQDDDASPAWLHSSYILPTPSNKLPVRYHAQLTQIPRSVRGGECLRLGLDFIDLQNANEQVSQLTQPLMLYLVFTPGAENYSIFSFIDWENIFVEGGGIICKDWEHNQQGACLLKMVIAAGDVLLDKQGVPRLWINLPVFETYLKGASCSITLAAAISHKMREGNLQGGQFTIEPNFEARVIYSSPQSAECFTLDRRTEDIQPSNVVIRALNFENGDVLLITQMLQGLGPQASYVLKPQGSHLLLLITSGEQKFRFLLENVALEDMLCNSAFIAIDQAPPEWLTYIYLSESYLQANAVAEADTVLTVKTLLNAFLNEEDYLSMQTVLDSLGQHED